MGITKQYLRFAEGPVFGVIGSSNGKINFVPLKNTHSRFVAASACENIVVWDIRTNEKALQLQGEKHWVTSMVVWSNGKNLAAGYSDGAVRVFDLQTGECTVTFNGHKSAVKCLLQDPERGRLISGGKDTEIVVWDVISESGLFRLKGHKGVITKCQIMKTKNILLSSSKDTLIKFWDLDTQHCFKTVVGHRNEIWDFVLIDDRRIITGTSEDKLFVWDITFSQNDESMENNPLQKEKVNTTDDDEAEQLSCTNIGLLSRKGAERILSMKMDSSQTLLGCHGTGNMLEIFKLKTPEEIEKYLTKKLKKMEKKLKRSAPGEEIINDPEPLIKNMEEEIGYLKNIKAGGKIKGFDIVQEKSGLAMVAILLHNNSIEVHSLVTEKNNVESDLVKSITMQGHRTAAETVQFSSDNSSILSASGDSVKVWNSISQQCVCTMECSYATCSLFAPGDRHCIVGNKNGKLLIYDISAATCLETIDAHSEKVTSICMSPDQRNVVSGSEDKEVKFWEYELVKDPNYSQTRKKLTLIHTRTLKLSDSVLVVKFSPDGRLLAVSLLDMTVKIFFVDTLKFFLCLYGHSLPVWCMDISYDSTLIVTGSDDRDVKIWGLDFGDCHKSIFAHENSILCTQFIPKTHMFFTGSKDKTLKLWDADNFKKILTLQGHQDEIWSLSVSPDGRRVVSSSKDKSLRLWQKTEEPLVLEEEEQIERENEYDKALIESETVIPGETNEETGLAGKKTLETLKGGERLLEALDVYKQEVQKLQCYKQECKAAGKELPEPTPHPLLIVYQTNCPTRYMMEVIKRIKSSELEKTLLMLTFSDVKELLHILSEIIEKGWEIELSCRCLYFLLRIHSSQIMKCEDLFPVIEKLAVTSKTQINKLEEMVGINLGGLHSLEKTIAENEEVSLFLDATRKYKSKKKKQKKIEYAIAINKISL